VSEAPLERWLLFDGDCDFCRRWCAWLQARGAERVARFAPCADAVELRERAGIDRRECDEAAILLEIRGQRVVSVRRAAAALGRLLAQLPGRRNLPWRCAGRLSTLPGARPLSEAAYRWVARRRHRFGCRPEPDGAAAAAEQVTCAAAGRSEDAIPPHRPGP
jgi:predicted DCC family thiol-disulfide oxidoreductase YuxK